MLIGTMSDVEEFGKLENDMRSNSLEAMLDEFRVNPVIDEQIRKNKVIMRELEKAVHRTMDPTFDIKK